MNIESRYKRGIAAASLTALGFVAAGCGGEASQANPKPTKSTSSPMPSQSSSSTPEVNSTPSSSEAKEIPISVVDTNLCNYPDLEQVIVKDTFATAGTCENNTNSASGQGEYDWPFGNDPSIDAAGIRIQNSPTQKPNSQSYNPDKTATNKPLSIEGQKCDYDTSNESYPFLYCYIGPDSGSARVIVDAFARDNFTTEQAETEIMTAALKIIKQKGYI